MKTILFPTDFSERADLALPHAINFAAFEGAELHLLHVLVLYASGSPSPEEFSGETEAREALDGVHTGETRVIRALIRGVAPGPAILAYADEHDVDLIVMGSHGRRGLRRLLLGSVTEEVIRAGRGPVLTVNVDTKRGPTSPNYARILAPVDFSEHTRAGLDTAADLARRFKATLHLLHVVDVPVLPELYGPVDRPVVDLKRAVDASSESVEELAAPLREELELETDVEVGGAVQQIVRHAEQADLVVIPTHGYSGLDRLLMGSVAEGVLRRASCPVLTLRAASGSRA